MNPSEEQYQTVSEYYRRAMEGHVYIRETLDTFLDVLGQRIEGLPRPTIVELGSHAGVVTTTLLERWPRASVVVSDDDESLVAMSRRRLASRSGVAYHRGSLGLLNQRVDLVVSVARHHHLPHDYLSDVRRVMGPGSVYVVADELCPEYCAGEHAVRVEQAEVIHVVGGYVLTTQAEVRAYQATGAIPGPALELERLRQRALWRWYRFVVDEAVERGYFDIAVGELQSTHDDLITGSDAEHKFSPLIVERQFQLAGFQLLAKRLIGPATDASRQSMFVYEFGLA